MEPSEKQLAAAHLRNLADEEIGVRHRFSEYYLPRFRAFCQQTGKNPSETTVLDCGCGNGASVEYMAGAGFRAFGFDLGEYRVEQWRHRSELPGVALVCADALEIPFPDGAFDIILNSGLVEHIGVAETLVKGRYRVRPTSDQAASRTQFMRELLRVLRPTGVLYIDYPNGAFPIDFFHGSYDPSTQTTNRPRFHSPWEKFLPTFTEVRSLLKGLEPSCRVEAISPAGRMTYNRSRRHWYGKVFGSLLERYFKLMDHQLFKPLAASPLNPYLVVRVIRQ